jgi:transposase
MEPVCAEVFPGNSIDASSYSAFIRDNDIKKGIIVADKGFPPSAIKNELKDRPELHFLTPIKRNDVRIGSNNMLDFEGVLVGVGAHVLHKKAAIKDGRFLYAFKDSKRAAAEEAAYLTNAEKQKNFDRGKYAKKKDLFGVIVFESDQDMPPETAYMCYDDRWLLELVFKRYKSDECLDRTNVQGDFSVIGSEFINFISTLITCRIIRKARIAGLLEKMTYGELMDDLSSAWRMVDAPMPPKSDDDYWVHTLNTVFAELEALDLSVPVPVQTPKKRGRPRKNPEVSEPKRPRGRPRKNTAQNSL